MSVKIFSCSKSNYLTTEIVKKYYHQVYGISSKIPDDPNFSTPNKSELKVFSDGEFCPVFNENVRGDKVFIVSSLYSLQSKNIYASESIMELLMMIDAAKRASASDIVAIIPYYAFARQDRKDRPRVPITAKLLADLLATAGTTRVIAIDFHSDQIQGYFNVPVDALQASYVFIPYLESLKLKKLKMCSPDIGGGKRTKIYADYFNTNMVFMQKDRAKANEIAKMELIGDVTDANVVLIDDIADTAGTITKAADILIDKGAKSVRACVTHPVLSGDAYEKINKSALCEFIVTDTIPLKIESEKIKVLSVSDLIAKAIYRMDNDQSISNLFKNEPVKI